MTVTVLAISETDFKPDGALMKIMTDRLKAAALQLQDEHLQFLHNHGQRSDDLVVYLSYNQKYKIRWHIVNDVPAEIESLVAEVCGKQGYIEWKLVAFDLFKNKS